MRVKEAQAADSSSSLRNDDSRDEWQPYESPARSRRQSRQQTPENLSGTRDKYGQKQKAPAYMEQHEEEELDIFADPFAKKLDEQANKRQAKLAAKLAVKPTAFKKGLASGKNL